MGCGGCPFLPPGSNPGAGLLDRPNGNPKKGVRRGVDIHPVPSESRAEVAGTTCDEDGCPVLSSCFSDGLRGPSFPGIDINRDGGR